MKNLIILYAEVIRFGIQSLEEWQKFDLLEFADNKKKVSFSASFGSSVLDDEYLNKAEKELKKFKAISVREEAGKTE